MRALAIVLLLAGCGTANYHDWKGETTTVEVTKGEWNFTVVSDKNVVRVPQPFIFNDTYERRIAAKEAAEEATGCRVVEPQYMIGLMYLEARLGCL